MQTTFVDRSGTVANSLATLEISPNLRMCLPALELVECRQVRVPVVERNNQAKVDLVIRRVIKEAAALGTVVQRPTRRVDNKPFFVTLRFNLPYFLDTDAIVLRIGVLSQIELTHDLFTEIAPDTFRKNRIFAEQLVPWRVRALLDAVLTDPHIARCYAGDASIGVIQNFRRGKSGKYVYAHALSLFSQPLT